MCLGFHALRSCQKRSRHPEVFVHLICLYAEVIGNVLVQSGINCIIVSFHTYFFALFIVHPYVRERSIEGNFIMTGFFRTETQKEFAIFVLDILSTCFEFCGICICHRNYFYRNVFCIDSIFSGSSIPDTVYIVSFLCPSVPHTFVSSVIIFPAEIQIKRTAV